jgi:hypothetical protein
LRQAQFIQSDIAFRRVVGFQEFELASLDRVQNVGELPNTRNGGFIADKYFEAITYVRVFVNYSLAFAHQRILEAIDDVVKEDTGSYLEWRHLHSESLDSGSYTGKILHWAGDQHGGQAKGELAVLTMHFVLIHCRSWSLPSNGGKPSRRT